MGRELFFDESEIIFKVFVLRLKSAGEAEVGGSLLQFPELCECLAWPGIAHATKKGEVNGGRGRV